MRSENGECRGSRGLRMADKRQNAIKKTLSRPKYIIALTKMKSFDWMLQKGILERSLSTIFISDKTMTSTLAQPSRKRERPITKATTTTSTHSKKEERHWTPDQEAQSDGFEDNEGVTRTMKWQWGRNSVRKVQHTSGGEGFGGGVGILQISCEWGNFLLCQDLPIIEIIAKNRFWRPQTAWPSG